MKITKTQLKNLVDFSESKVWKDSLKPYLELIKYSHGSKVVEPTSEFEAAKHEIKRIERIKTVEELIKFVETSDEKLDKIRKEKSNGQTSTIK